jgi:cell division protein FtsW (lipid II flippase)
MIVAVFFSSRINGAIGWITIGPISFNVFHISIFTLVVSLAGIFAEWHWSNRKSIIQGSLLAFGPCILFIQSYSMAHIGIYIIAVITLMIISGVKLRYIAYPMGGIGTLLALFILNEPYRFRRITSFLRPMEDPEGAGWIYNQLNTIRNSATLFGQDPASVSIKLPSADADYILTYIIYSFGWIVAFILIATILAFIIRIGAIGLKTKDRYGRLIVTGLSALFITQFLMNILMNFTLIPTISINMPFISYGGSSLLINMISIAIILNVFKWRNTPYVAGKI